MRNIKITALLLAVLMVVAAFAGCASKSTVSNLDNKVNDLDGKLQEQANALTGIQDSIKDLADAIGNTGSADGLDDIKADVEANKQSVADILAAIESLKDAVAGATGESEDVKTAINQAGAKIDALKNEYADNKKHYNAEDYDKIVAALGAAQAAISTGVTAEAVAAVLAEMDAELAKYVRVDDSIYAYYVALKGNITAESEELVEEAVEALAAAKKFYNKAFGDTEALEEYEYDEDEDALNLFKEIGDLEDLQKDRLPVITKKAKEIVKKIDKALAGETVDLAQLRREYKTFVKDAKELSEKNVALVTNADKIEELIASEEKIDDAVAALRDEFDGAYPSMLRKYFGQEKTIFFDYVTLVNGDAAAEIEAGSQSVFTFETKKSNKNAIGRTIAIYDEIDERLEKLAEDYELSEDGIALVVAKFTGNANFLAKYEADKALVKAFEAEYEKLAEGVFADIAELAEAKLTVSAAYDLATAYKANADAINAWAKALIDAYVADYKKLSDKEKAKVSYTDATYDELVLANFQAMVVEAQLVGWEDKDTDTEDSVHDWKHNAEFNYTGAFDDEKHNDGTNDFYYDLYDFDRADNADLKAFLKKDGAFEKANDAAEKLNAAIKAYRENQAISIVELLTTIGGYVEVGTNEDGKPALVAVRGEDDEAFANGANGYAQGTIAWFMHEFKTEDYDLSGLVNVAAYDAKVAAIEKNVEEAEAALKALMDAYNAILDEKDTVVVTLDNADAIIALKALLVKVNANGHIDMQKAILDEDTANDDVKEYELKTLVADYLAANETPAEFYERVLKATNYADTTKGSVNTGAITRLVYKAEALKKEASIVASAYNMMQKLNAAFGGKAFAYANNYNGYAVVNNMNNADYRNLATYGYMYGVISYEATSKVVGNTTEYGYKMSFVRFNADKGGFYAGSRDSMAADEKYTTADEAVRGAWNYIKTWTLAGALNITSANEFYTYMFADNGYLKSTIKATDAEALNTVFKDRVIPAFALPMMASYLEAKFIINNMGKTAAEITTAKNGWGEPTSNYGFGYIKAMVVNQLNGKVNDSRLDAIGSDAKNYDQLTRAVMSACQDVALNESIILGAADAAWLSETYDITKVDYAMGGSEAATIVDDYAAHGIKLDELVAEGIVIYEVEAAQEPVETEAAGELE